MAASAAPKANTGYQIRGSPSADDPRGIVGSQLWAAYTRGPRSWAISALRAPIAPTHGGSLGMASTVAPQATKEIRKVRTYRSTESEEASL